MNYLNWDKNKCSKAIMLATLCYGWSISSSAIAAQTVNVGAISQVPPTMIGANTVTRQHLPHHQPWYDSLSINTITDTNFSVLRYPGGSLGNKFDWTLGVQKEYAHLAETRQYLPEHTKVATDATDGKTLWMLNVYDETLTATIDALKIARDKGAEIKYIELGNEFYFLNIDGLEYTTRFPTGTDYGQEMNTWISALKAEFPDTVFAVPMTRAPNNDPETRKSKWNADVDAALTDYDAFTIHVYADISPKDSVTKIPMYAGFDYETLTPSEQQAQRDHFTGNPDAVKYILGLAEATYDGFLAHPNLWYPSGKDIWFTEFGMRYYPHAVKGTWVEALADFTLYKKLLSQPNATMATEQQFIDLAHGSTSTYANVAIDVGQDLTTTVGALTAEGHAIKAISAMARDKELMSTLTFPQASVITPATIAPYSALSGLMFSDSNSSNAVIANVSGTVQSIDTASFGPAGADVTVISAANYYTFITDNSDVTYTSSTMGATLDIPPYSIVTIENINTSLDPQDGSVNYTPKFTDARIAEAASDSLSHAFDVSRHVVDQNTNDSLSFSLTGVNPSWVSINGSGLLEFNASGQTIGTTHEVFVRVDDGHGATDYVTFDVEIVDGSLDTDGDNLTNNDEFAQGLNALNVDTDGDGVNDDIDEYPLDPALSSNQDPGYTEVLFDDFDNGFGNWVDGGADVLNTPTLALGEKSLRIRSGLGDESSSWLVNSLDLTSYQLLRIKFSYMAGSMEAGEGFAVKVSNDGGTNWQTVASYLDTDFNDLEWNLDQRLNLTNQDIVFTNDMQIRFESLASGSGDYVNIDNVAILVANNDAPTWSANPITAADATDSSLYSSSISAFAADNENDALSFSKVSGPAWLNVANNGQVTGTPSSADVGLNSFVVAVNDGINLNVETVLDVNVNALPNSAPTWNDTDFSQADATPDTLYTTWVNWRVTDAEGDPLTYTLISGPAWLSITNTTTAKFEGTPSISDVGVNNFVISVSDGINPAVQANMSIEVLAPVNSAPVWNSDPISTADASKNQSYNQSLAGLVTDADGDTLTFTKVSGSSWLTVSSSGQLTGTPRKKDIGNHSFVVSVSDGVNPAVQVTLNITVNN
ncbi:putative Ig domain-containing protein [Thalassomonas sp. M1454]|uniref:putative Ig domain-containing protein n=1 Tax=Thalassomonas sp. M1454 TaxID=2594477 RepID=UPI00117DB696|nr:putative Ig domain-containing protein [Thalassomonas sp. M1454]TRX56678.1 hypothetical protein FNN08_03890 [Thalassomonas sp. M1454]